MRSALHLLIAALTLAALPAHTTTAPPLSFYAAKKIDPPPGFDHCAAVALNERGQLLCQATSEAGSAAFLWSPEGVALISSSTGSSTYGFALDDSGRVAGADRPLTGAARPFIWAEGVFTWLPVPPGFSGAEARAISNDGSVAGDALDPTGNHYACLWHDGTVSLLPALPGRPYSQVRGMNDHGQIAGACFEVFDPAAPHHAGRGRAVMWQDGEALDLGTVPGYSFSEAYAVNNGGTVVGAAYELPSFSRGFVWTPGGSQLLPTGYVPSAIDDLGRITGAQQYGGAFELLGGEMKELERITSGEYGRVLADVPALNEQRQAAATGRLRDGVRAFLLSPIAADVETAVRLSAAGASAGDVITATITITNRGDSAALHPYLGYYAWDGVRVVSANSPDCSVRFDQLWANASDDLLPPGETRTLVLGLECMAAGRVEIQAYGGASNDPDYRNFYASAYL